jgi:hypothetical protein
MQVETLLERRGGVEDRADRPSWHARRHLLAWS